MATVKANLGDLTDAYTVIIRGMHVSENTAEFIPTDWAQSVRTTISRLHSDTDKKFVTKKTTNGILVWRTA